MKDYWQDLTTGQKIKLVVTILLIIISLIFVVRNWQPTEVFFVFFSMYIPLTLIILVSGGIGFAAASLFRLKKDKKFKDEIKILNTKLNIHEAQKVKISGE